MNMQYTPESRSDFQYYAKMWIGKNNRFANVIFFAICWEFVRHLNSCRLCLSLTLLTNIRYKKGVYTSWANSNLVLWEIWWKWSRPTRTDMKSKIWLLIVGGFCRLYRHRTCKGVELKFEILYFFFCSIAIAKQCLDDG